MQLEEREIGAAWPQSHLARSANEVRLKRDRKGLLFLFLMFGGVDTLAEVAGMFAVKRLLDRLCQ